MAVTTGTLTRTAFDFLLPQPVRRSSGRLFEVLRPLPRPPLLPRRTEPVPTLGRLGSLEARLAVTPEDIRRAQALRYKVFYEEMGATADAATRLTRRDADRFDRLADHVLVLDHDAPEARPFGRSRARVVGTYRMLRQERALRAGGFYSQDEYHVEQLVRRHPDKRFLELGRSCVLPEWRSKRSLELLWMAIWAYARQHRVDALFGCASFPGADPAAHRAGLALLQATALAPQEWRVSALAHRRVDMAGDPSADPRRVLQTLPPLIKGYLRVGAYVGDGAVVDRPFGTTDVLMILPVARIGDRYLKHFD